MLKPGGKNLTRKMEETIDPWKSEEIKDYEALSKKFGIDSFEKFKGYFPENRYVRRGIIFGQRDFARIFQAIQEKKPWVMMTGLMPSGKFHLGHKMVAEQIIWYQSLGAEIYLCCADLESYLMRGIELKEAKRTAISEYLKNYVALGLREKNLTFWFQSDYRICYCRLKDKFSKKVTFNELKAIYGSLTPGKIISALTQVADILHPQLKELGGPRPTVVPVGIDQDPHIRLTRDVAARFKKEYKFIPPSSTYHKFMPGLQGGKMSSSDEKSFISLTEEPEKARKKIMRAKTGGRATVAEQKEKGGIPEKCLIFELYKYHLIDDDRELEKIYQDCKSGKLLCGDCKLKCADLMEGFLKKHQEKLKNPETEKIVERILERK